MSLLAACGQPERSSTPPTDTTASNFNQTKPTTTVAPPKPTVDRRPFNPTPPPTTDPTPAAAVIPTCVFDSTAPAAAPAKETLASYQFGEPTVVLIGDILGIDGWLPDNQRLLATHWLADEQIQAVETINVQTGATQRYAEKSAGSDGRSIWMEAEQAVFFTDRTPDGYVARIGRSVGGNLQTEEVQRDLQNSFATINPRQQYVGIAKDTPLQPQIVSNDLKTTSTVVIPALAPQHDSLPDRNMGSFGELKSSWHPNGEEIAFYSSDGLFLVNARTGTTCDVDLGEMDGRQRWVLSANWSPDGQFLALLTSSGGSLGDLSFISLDVLERTNGRLYSVVLDSNYAIDVTWMPNSRHMIVGVQEKGTEGLVYISLRLVDFMQGTFTSVLPQTIVGYGTYSHEGAIEIASDGSKLALNCPLLADLSKPATEQRICMASIAIKQ